MTDNQHEYVLGHFSKFGRILDFLRDVDKSGDVKKHDETSMYLLLSFLHSLSKSREKLEYLSDYIHQHGILGVEGIFITLLNLCKIYNKESNEVWHRIIQQLLNNESKLRQQILQDLNVVKTSRGEMNEAKFFRILNFSGLEFQLGLNLENSFLADKIKGTIDRLNATQDVKIATDLRNIDTMTGDFIVNIGFDILTGNGTFNTLSSAFDDLLGDAGHTEFDLDSSIDVESQKQDLQNQFESFKQAAGGLTDPITGFGSTGIPDGKIGPNISTGMFDTNNDLLERSGAYTKIATKGMTEGKNIVDSNMTSFDLTPKGYGYVLLGTGGIIGGALGGAALGGAEIFSGCAAYGTEAMASAGAALASAASALGRAASVLEQGYLAVENTATNFPLATNIVGGVVAGIILSNSNSDEGNAEQSAAMNAQTAATNAKTAATNAQTQANDAQTKADEDKQAAEQARKEADEAQATFGITGTEGDEQNAKKKEEEATKKEEEAEESQKKADELKKQADQAAEDAKKAQEEADKAKKKAEEDTTEQDPSSESGWQDPEGNSTPIYFPPMTEQDQFNIIVSRIQKAMVSDQTPNYKEDGAWQYMRQGQMALIIKQGNVDPQVDDFGESSGGNVTKVLENTVIGHVDPMPIMDQLLNKTSTINELKTGR